MATVRYIEKVPGHYVVKEISLGIMDYEVTGKQNGSGISQARVYCASILACTVAAVGAERAA